MTRARPSGTWTTAGCNGRVFTAFSPRASSSTVLVPEPGPHLHPSDDGPPLESADASNDSLPGERLRSALLFLGIVLLIGVDLVEDWRRGSRGLHLGLESVVLVLAAIGLWLLRSRMHREQAARRALRARLREVSAAAESWRRETEVLSAGLGRAIDSQFQSWKLTEAEREVALLLLKGLSLRGDCQPARNERADGPPAVARRLPEGGARRTGRALGVLSRGPARPCPAGDATSLICPAKDDQPFTDRRRTASSARTVSASQGAPSAALEQLPVMSAAGPSAVAPGPASGPAPEPASGAPPSVAPASTAPASAVTAVAHGGGESVGPEVQCRGRRPRACPERRGELLVGDPAHHAARPIHGGDPGQSGADGR